MDISLQSAADIGLCLLRFAYPNSRCLRWPTGKGLRLRARGGRRRLWLRCKGERGFLRDLPWLLGKEETGMGEWIIFYFLFFLKELYITVAARFNWSDHFMFPSYVTLSNFRVTPFMWRHVECDKPLRFPRLAWHLTGSMISVIRYSSLISVLIESRFKIS